MTSVPQPPRCAIYVRVSTAGQEQDGTSLDTQEAACRAYADKLGYEVTDLYREVHTGVELWERPRLTELRDAVRRHQVDVMVAYAIDRLARDPVHLGVIISEADHAGVRVEFVTEPLDASPEGELIRFVRGYAAKVEHTKITERTMRGKVARAQEGRPIVGAYPPYGYQWQEAARGGRLVKTTLILDDDRAPLVRWLFEEAAAGRSLWQLAADLETRGIRTTKGRARWQVSTLHDILRNPIYTGTVAAFRHRRGGGAPIVTRDAVPAIVSEELFDAVATRFQLNKAAASRNHHDPEATLLRGGYAVCGHCGATMYALRRPLRVGYHYRCSGEQYDPTRCRQHTIVASELDGQVWRRVSAVLRTPALIREKIAELRQDDPTTADLDALDRRITLSTRQRDTYLTHVGNAPSPEVADLMMGKVAALTEELGRLAHERSSVLARRHAWEQAQAGLADLEERCRQVAGRLDAADYALKRDALEWLGVRVKVFRPGSPERFVVEAVRATPEGEIVSVISAGRAP